MRKWVIFKGICFVLGLLLIIVSYEHVDNEVVTLAGWAYTLGVGLAMFSGVSLVADYDEYNVAKKQKKITDFEETRDKRS